MLEMKIMMMNKMTRSMFITRKKGDNLASKSKKEKLGNFNEECIEDYVLYSGREEIKLA